MNEWEALLKTVQNTIKFNCWLFLETKGIHLKGNEDTEYKKKLLETLETKYKTAIDGGEMRTVGETPAVFRILFENNWEETAGDIIAEQ